MDSNNPTLKNKTILVAGASVSGNTVAWWLARQGFQVTVVEKANSFREGGQNVDVRGAARQVLRRMGLEQAAQRLTTGEQGTDWVDEQDHVIAHFAVKDIGEGPTAELEIMRGDLSRLLYEPTRQYATYRFGDSISALEQNEAGALVTFESGARERYDLVIIAEGVGSSTREMLFPGENRPRYLNLTIAYFGIPGQDSDSPFARQYNTVGGRGATVKPGRDGRLHVYMGIYKRSQDEQTWPVEQQKSFLCERFGRDGWEFSRILQGMVHTDDFYFDVLRQVKLKRWSKSRVVLTGDAAWCATPLSGIGTSLAIVGGYVLAGELAKSNDYGTAFATYERVMRPYVEEGQGVPQLVPRLLWPHTRLGLRLLRWAMRLASTPLLRKLFARFFLRDSTKIELPDYPLRAEAA